MQIYPYYGLQCQTHQPKKYLKDTYELIGIDLGQGTYGKVKLAQNRKNLKKYAIKIISKSYIKQYKADQHIQNEINFLKCCDHKNIVQYIEHFEDNNNIYIVMEYCSNGTLYDIVKRKKKLCEEEAFHYFYQIAQALQYLHEKDIVHRDIKSDNILLDGTNVKICDFNWSIYLPGGGKAKPCHCGTTEYMPPEVVKKEKHDKYVDIWALGVLLYYLLHGELIFRGKTKEELIEKICKKNTIKFDPQLSQECKELLSGMLSHQKRINIVQVLNSEWAIKMLQLRNTSQQQLKLTPIKNRASAYDLTKFSMVSDSTCFSYSKFTTKSRDFESPLKTSNYTCQSVSRQLQFVSQQPVKVKAAGLNQNISAFRVEKKFYE